MADETVDTFIKAQGVLGGANAPALVTGATMVQLYESLAAVTKLDDLPGFAKATFAQSGSATSGLTAYDLEAPAKLFYPVLTPLRNMIPRVSGKGGIQANWRAITNVNTANLDAGVSEGNRNALLDVSQADYAAAYKGIGFESNATFEAQYAGEGFDDVRKRAAQTGLHSLMLAEEKLLLAGNGSLALGTTPTPSLTAATTGGALAAATYNVFCVALTFQGYNRSTVAGGITATYNRTNADSSVDAVKGGVAQKSAAASVAVGGSGAGKITATVTPVRGATAYAWYWGLSGSELLGAITTVPAYVVTATATGTQNISVLPSADNSANSLHFDGLITQALKAGSGAYWADLLGATLTSDGDGGIVEIDALLKDRWDNYRLNPDTLWVNSQQAKDITTKVLQGTTNGALRFNVDIKQGMIAGGTLVTSYLNKYGQDGVTEVKIRQHPNMAPGTILSTQSSIPYPLADVSNVFQVRTRQDYYQIEWPLRSRKYEYGVYADEVLQCYFPPSLGVISGIGAG